jgi:MerR family copper efflux transcriptional regulator
MSHRLPLLNNAIAVAESSEEGSEGRDRESAPEIQGALEEVQDLMQVGDLARESGKTVRAIHLYEELELLRPAARSKGRYRLYAKDALTRIRWIGKLQEMGFTLTDIQTVLREWEQSSSAPRAMVGMRELYKKKLEETTEQLRAMQSLKRELEASLTYLDTCEVCDPDRLLSACKKCDLHDCSGHVPDLVAGFRANQN